MADASPAARRVPARHAIALSLLALLALALAARAALLFFEPGLGGAATDADAGTLFWLNLLPVLLVLGVLFGVTGKMLFSAWTGYWLLWALHVANAEKIEHLSRSLRPGDFSALPTFLGSPGLFLPYLDDGGGALWLAAGGIAIGIALLLVEPRSLRLAWPLRLLFAAACGFLLVSLFRDDVWAERFSPAFGKQFHLWAPNEGIERSGLIAGLMKLSWAAHVGRLAPDVAAIERFTRDNRQAIVQRGERPLPAVLPDVVIVQSESLFDPADLRGIAPGDVLPEFRRLAARGLSGRLKVPTFAGGTIRTEYELISGYPLDAFPTVEYPYLGIALQTPNSLPNTLARFGYEATMLHPFQREFWNREAALRALGFDRLLFLDDFADAPTHGWYVTDEAVFDRMLDLLPDHGPPQLMLAVTMQNHGPWNKPRSLPPDELARQPLPEGLSEHARLELGNYLALVEAGDRALGPFAQRLLARERPTLLLVFGDHLPDLGNAYAELGFDDDDVKPWQQTVPYLLVGNVGYPQAHLDTESEFLAALLLDALRVPYDGYFAINASVRDELAFSMLPPPEQNEVRAALRAAAQRDYASGDATRDDIPAVRFAAP